MVSSRKSEEASKPKRRPATTPEAQENRMISLAVDLAEKQIREGTASSTIIVHYLKLGTTRERLEQEKMRRENLLLESRVESLKSAKSSEELYKKALDAMRSYSGQNVVEEYDYED